MCHVLDSGDGDDVIIGGAGDDIVSGGNGTDRFMLDNGTDIVIDFEAGQSGDILLLPLTYEKALKASTNSLNGLAIRQDDTRSILLYGIAKRQFRLNNMRYCIKFC